MFIFKFIFKALKYFAIIYIAIGVVRMAGSLKETYLSNGSGQISYQEISNDRIRIFGFPDGSQAYGDTLIVNLK